MRSTEPSTKTCKTSSARSRKWQAGVVEISELWNVGSWFAERRRELDRKYDYYYSVLPSASAALVKQELISEKDLHGLSAERSDLIVVG